ncbi:hypothetical protein MKW92_015822 [Papaver armeniacum]|nr:hypothetical protein MKW92_015822 [Papaver armeniacum]
MDNTVAETLCVQTPNGRVMSSEHPAFWNGIPPNFFVYYEGGTIGKRVGVELPRLASQSFATSWIICAHCHNAFIRCHIIIRILFFCYNSSE